MTNKTIATKNLPRDVFLYLLSIISLIAVAVSFGILLFQYINIYFPDIVSDPYGRSQYFSQVRQALAALIVFFPVYIWVSRFLKRDIKENPEKRELKIRKWLLYLTLFVAAIVIIVDLIALVNNFLEGELTLRFILKVLSILFIAGSVFYYYLNELRDEKSVNEKRMVVFSWVVILLVIAGAASSFFFIGSPKTQRMIRLDEKRVNDLQFIHSQIVQYWQSKNKLPQNLEELENDITGISAPKDPETGSPYEYKILDDLKFQLCANFATESAATANNYKYRYAPMPVPDQFYNVTWEHGVGRVCFDRTIDPDIIKPFDKPRF